MENQVNKMLDYYNNLISINKDIVKLNISSFFYSLFFDRAIWTLFLLEKGLDGLQVGLAESLLHISIVLFEVPTGIIADIYGRKISLIISRIISIIYAVGLMSVNNIWSIYFIFILFGLGSTFSSGSDTALLYDSIKGNKKEKDKQFTKINGYYGAFITAGLTLGMFCGGFLQSVSWNTVYLYIAVVQVISIIPLINMTDNSGLVKAKQGKNQDFSFLVCLKNLVISNLIVFKNRLFFTLVIGIVIFTATINTLYLFIPIWFKEQGFDEIIISQIFTLDSIIGIIAYSCAYKLEKKVNIYTLLIILPLISLIALLLLPITNSLSPILFIIINNLAILFYPLSSALINKLIKSEERATILSSVSFLSSIIIAIQFPTIGFLTKYIDTGFVLSGLSIFCLCSIILLWQTNRKGILNYNEKRYS